MKKGPPSASVALVTVVGVIALVWLILRMGSGSKVLGTSPGTPILSNFNLAQPQSVPWLGVEVQSPAAQPSPKAPKPDGTVVATVIPNSPADQAGIQIGDVIRRVDKKPITSPNDLIQVISASQAGDTLRIIIDRNGEDRALRVTLGSLPLGTLAAATNRMTANSAWLGADIQPIDSLLAQRFGLPNTHGVIVSYVYPNSPAFAAGLMQGDVIWRINETNLGDPTQFMNLLSDRRPGEAVRLTVWQRQAIREIQVVLTNRPPRGNQPKIPLPEAEVEIEAAWLGLDIVELTPAELKELGLPMGLRGMLVDDVAKGRGVDAGFVIGDVIVAVNGKSTPTVMDLKEATEGAVGAVVDVIRAGHHLYLSVPPPGSVKQAGDQKPPLRQVMFGNW